ncbi:UDP-glucose:glycoprotein glucosyltransferase-domain-containing protein [Lipomyces oligophaga]|uniref:UDP-glucose:glycoprotein glucosyltransferase-domain-containing protein n=1 Tax=Lipomyces oligophaga TaxID=45792 RepID=UPI0034CF323B
MVGSRLIALLSVSLVSQVLLGPLFCNGFVDGVVNVNLKLEIPWTDSSPYILELVETVSEEAPASYFPLLAHLAEFSEQKIVDGLDEGFSLSHKDLFEEALDFVVGRGYYQPSDPALDWIKLQLSTRSSAPKVQAYYQYYNETILPQISESLASCGDDSWFWYDNHVSCDPADVFTLKTPSKSTVPEILPFDHQLSKSDELPVAILYADVALPKFLQFHNLLLAEAENGKLRYILRFKPSNLTVVRKSKIPLRPLGLSGYGVELALKRTDYIVIDDRDQAVSGTDGHVISKEPTEDEVILDVLFADQQTKDIKPLKKYELEDLSWQTAGFVLQDHKEISKLDLLVKILQDYPKYASSLASVTVENLAEIRDEMADNLESLAIARFAQGDNAIFVNGARVDSQLTDDLFGIMSIIKRERKFVNDLKWLNLSTKVVSDLIGGELSLKLKDQPNDPRFDMSDTIEGGGAIIWLNDLEFDPMYQKFYPSIQSILTSDGRNQFQPIKKNIHQIVIPVDTSMPEELFLVQRNLKAFIERGLAIQFGIVPIVETKYQRDVALLIYNLYHKVGKDGIYQLFEQMLKGDTEVTQSVVESLAQGPEMESIEQAAAWGKRLDVHSGEPMAFANGFVFQRGGTYWLQNVAVKLDSDVKLVQTLVKANVIDDDTDVPIFLLKVASPRRNRIIFPEDPNDEKLIDLVALFKEYRSEIGSLPTLYHHVEKTQMNTNIDLTLLVASDFDSANGIKIFQEALKFLTGELQFNVKARFLHIPGIEKNTPTLSTFLHFLSQGNLLSSISPQQLLELTSEIIPTEDFTKLPHVQEFFQDQSKAKVDGWAVPDNAAALKFWDSLAGLRSALGIYAENSYTLLNSRKISLPSSGVLDKYDFESLLKRELAMRITPAISVATSLGVFNDLSPDQDKYDFIAQLTGVTSLSDRTNIGHSMLHFANKRNSQVTSLQNIYSSFDAGEIVFDNAELKIVAIVNPVSEFAQKFIPMIKVLVGIPGISARIFLNPEFKLKEIPIKRFYRFSIDSAPAFDQLGRIIEPEAAFNDLPSEVLLTLELDVPDSWLTTPKEAKYDLDNIVLSSVSESKVEALYVLTNILVQGHARDISEAGQPPAGLQLTLGSLTKPVISDTVVMANLGYFQFKSQPGVWKLGLKPGLSQTIFHLVSAGTEGWSSVSSDDANVYVTSFAGVRIYPQMSRNAGQEHASIYEEQERFDPSIMGQVHHGVKQAQKAITSFIKKTTSRRRSGTGPADQAAINIFSVASGHLYERFLNIMFVSVMRHTNETVKFWLIDNFLSPSFKEFLPYMAEEYDFDYELITYKWPHWLRSQKEKQRTIWGYKILFLDVLFPLDLEKVIFVDADQIVRTDLKELVDVNLHEAPYGYTPMCDSRKEMEGFRFWKQGYWKNFLKGKPYHISALYVIDLVRFRRIGAGDILRQHYHTLSADPNSLSNLDQDLPNNLQNVIPIHSLPQDWLWCETWCSDESLKTAKTIDLCNNPMTKEPKLDRARRQVPEWTAYDDEIAQFAEKVRNNLIITSEDNDSSVAQPVRGDEPAETEEEDNASTEEYTEEIEEVLEHDEL